MQPKRIVAALSLALVAAAPASAQGRPTRKVPSPGAVVKAVQGAVTSLTSGPAAASRTPSRNKPSSGGSSGGSSGSGTSSHWWEAWARFSLSNDAGTVRNEHATVGGPNSGGTDEGRDPYDRGYATPSQWSGAKVLAYMEGAGTAISYIGALDDTSKRSGGFFPTTPGNPLAKFKADPRGAASVIATYWTWPYSGPLEWQRWTPSGGVPIPPVANPQANTFVWLGLQNFVDGDSWLGNYTIKNSTFGISPSAATYPDGKPATGYIGDPLGSDPRNAALFDALATKDVNGAMTPPKYTARTGCDATKCAGHLFVPGQGWVGRMEFSKDITAPFWLQQAQSAGTDLVAHGADGLWVDNYSGWNDLGCSGNGRSYNFDPIECAFGDWSVAKFRDYLAAHPVVGINPSTFDVTAYLRGRGLPWNDPAWTNDPIWMRYVAFKSQTAHNYEQSFYDAVKAKAAALKKDVLVSGNDVPLSSFASIHGTELDMPYFEYEPDWGFGVPIGLPPVGHTGPVYALATTFGKSPRAVSYYSLPTAKFGQLAHDETTVRYLSMEALANDTYLPTGGTDPGLLVNDSAARWADDAIASFASTFGNRVRAGRIGVVFSPETQNSFLTPGGYAYFTSAYDDNPAGYLGWASALEALHFPYRAVPDFRLTSANLSGLSVLILPSVRAIEPETVANVLIPFMQNGGTVIVTGQDSGSLHTQAGFYAPNSSALLYDLATTSSYAANGQAMFLGGNPGASYYTLQPGALQAISGIVDNLVANGKLKRDYELGGALATQNVVVTEHVDTAAHRWFFDLLNTNLNVSGDHASMRPLGSGTIKILVPSDPSFTGRSVAVTILDPDARATTMTLKPSSGYVTVPVSALSIYKSIAIQPA